MVMRRVESRKQRPPSEIDQRSGITHNFPDLGERTAGDNRGVAYRYRLNRVVTFVKRDDRAVVIDRIARRSAANGEQTGEHEHCESAGKFFHPEFQLDSTTA